MLWCGDNEDENGGDDDGIVMRAVAIILANDTVCHYRISHISKNRSCLGQTFV